MVKLGSFFVTGKRDNGEMFVSLKDERPEWLHEAVHAAHGSDLPNDWIYAECRAACDAIDDGSLTLAEDSDDGLHEHADSRVDIYTRELYQWAADMCLSDAYANAESEAADILGDESDTIKRLGAIQYCAIRSIAATILDAARENVDETEESEASAV
jgi:hypothetical protein